MPRRAFSIRESPFSRSIVRTVTATGSPTPATPARTKMATASATSGFQATLVHWMTVLRTPIRINETAMPTDWGMPATHARPMLRTIWMATGSAERWTTAPTDRTRTKPTTTGTASALPATLATIWTATGSWTWTSITHRRDARRTTARPFPTRTRSIRITIRSGTPATRVRTTSAMIPTATGSARTLTTARSRATRHKLIGTGIDWAMPATHVPRIPQTMPTTTAFAAIETIVPPPPTPASSTATRMELAMPATPAPTPTGITWAIPGLWRRSVPSTIVRDRPIRYRKIATMTESATPATSASKIL